MGPDGTEVILVNNKTNGQTGEFGDELQITSSAQGIFLASYTFDPDGSFPAGYYSLYFKVTDQHGNSDTDEYPWNLWGLRITTSAEEPSVDSGATQVIPNMVDKKGEGVTTISTQFEDPDSDHIDNFTVIFMIRHEDGREFLLVDSAKNGQKGEYGGTLTITSSSPNVYMASYVFNPPDTIPNGNYSLYFKVVDEWGSFAQDGYENNANELMIVGEETEDETNVFSAYYLYLLLLIILVIILLIAVALAAGRRRNKGDGKEPDSEEGPELQDEESYEPSELPSQDTTT
jgi:hypothetical protein